MAQQLETVGMGLPITSRIALAMRMLRQRLAAWVRPPSAVSIPCDSSEAAGTPATSADLPGNPGVGDDAVGSGHPTLVDMPRVAAGRPALRYDAAAHLSDLGYH